MHTRMLSHARYRHSPLTSSSARALPPLCSPHSSRSSSPVWGRSLRSSPQRSMQGHDCLKSCLQLWPSCLPLPQVGSGSPALFISRFWALPALPLPLSLMIALHQTTTHKSLCPVPLYPCARTALLSKRWRGHQPYSKIGYAKGWSRHMPAHWPHIEHRSAAAFWYPPTSA